MTIQEALEKRRQSMQQAEQIRQTAKDARTWGVQQNSTLAFTPPKVEVPEEKKTSADQMWDRNSQPQKIKETTRKKQIADRTKKELEDYAKQLGSKRKELTGTGGQNLVQNNPYGYNQELQREIQDMERQERVLRAKAEQAEKEYNEAEDRKRFEADMEVITGLPEEQRLALERYSASKYGARDILGDEIIAEMVEEYGQPRLDELERTFTRDKNARRAEAVDAKTREFVNERGGRGFLANLVSIPVKAYSGLIATGGQLGEMVIGTGGYKTLDPNAYGTIGNTFTNAIRDQTSENIIEDLGDGFVGQAANIGYQVGMTSADTIARAYLGGGSIGGATLAATGTFSETMADASRQGATPAQAAAMATTYAFVELAAEKIPLDELIKVAGGEAGKSVIRNIIKQAGIEIAEEEITLLADLFLEAAILKEKSDFNQSVNKYILEDGLTPDAAVQQANMDILNEALGIGLVSALSGSASATAAEYKAYRTRANQLNTTPNMQNAEDIKADTMQKLRDMEEQQAQQAQETAQPAQSAQPVQKPTQRQKPTAEKPKANPQEQVRPVEQPAAEQKPVPAKTAQTENVRKSIEDTMAALGAESAQKATQQAPVAPVQEATREKNAEVGNGEDTDYGLKGVSFDEEIDLYINDKNTAPKILRKYMDGKKRVDIRKIARDKKAVAWLKERGLDATQVDLNKLEGSEGYRIPGIEEKVRDIKASRAKPTASPVKSEVRQEPAQKPDVSEIVADMIQANNQQKQEQETVQKQPQQTEYKEEDDDWWGFGEKPEQEQQEAVKEQPQQAEESAPASEDDSDDLEWWEYYPETKNIETPVQEQKKQDVSDVIADMVRENTAKQNEQEQKKPNVVDIAADIVQKNTETKQKPAQTDTAPKTQQQEQANAEEPATSQQRTQQTDMQNQSTSEGQNIKGTGAAEQNFTGKAEYQNLLSEDNVQRDRPGDVRPMDVPKTDSFGKHVSELVGNAYGAEVTTDKMANAIEELVQDGALGFDRRSNQESMNRAAADIQKRGVAATRNQITNAVQKGKIKDGDIEKAILLYTMYNSKDTPTAIDNASEILVDLATMANITGRNLQMFRMLRQLTPAGQVATIKKTVERNVNKMVQSGAVKKGYEASIDPELMKEYQKAAGENMRAVSEEQKKKSAEKMQMIMDTIYSMEASKMPATMKAKWDAWRYMAMLGNAKTQVRNVAGNALFVPYKEVKDRTAALAEKLFVPKDKRTKAVFTDPKLLQWARQDRNTQNVKDALQYSAKLGDDLTDQKFRDKAKVFDNKALEATRKFIESVPQAGDMLFKNGYYARTLADFMKARGYTASDIQNGKVSAEVLNEARAYAVQEAMKATFNDSNVLSDFLSTDLRYKGENPVGKLYNTALEGVLPFRKTPANIMVRFEEYSPLGIANTIWKGVDAIRGGKSTAADVIDAFSASLTGTGAMALGYFMAKGLMGIKLTGSNTGEDEERQGHQDYALEWADKGGQEYSYKIDWAAPANLPLFVGANIYNAIESAGEDTDVSKFTSFLRGMGNAFEPMLALSCLSGVNDLFESARYAEEGEALYTVASNIATGYFTQGVPALLRQASQASQEYKQTTFANSNDPTMRDLQTTAANIPFVGDKFKTDKVNVWGEKEGQGTAFERTVDAFLNPGTLKKIDNSAVEREISRLNKAQEQSVSPSYIPKVVSYTDKSGTYHSNHRLSEEEYQKLAQTQGQTAKAILESMISSKNYAAMNDEQKAKAMKMAYSYAREKAMADTFDTSYSETWMMKLTKGKEAEQIIRRTSDNAISNALSKLDTAWDSGYSNENIETYSRELSEQYDSYSKMDAAAKREVKATATGTAAKYIEAREKGISHDDFVNVARNVNNAKGTGAVNKDTGKATVRDIDKRQAIAKTAGLTDREVDIIMKAYMPDYDRNDESPETTEFKYQYAREELGLSPKEYAATYNAYLNQSKKNQRIKAIQALGYDYSTAESLYKLYYGSMKKQLIEMYG